MSEEIKKHPGGRPTKYKPEYCDLTKYLKSSKVKGELPSICGYAVYLGVSEKTLENWGKTKEEFFRSLRKLLTISKQTLMNKGLKGTYNSTIAKLILSSDHGMRERTDQTSDDKPLSEPVTLADVVNLLEKAKNVGSGLDIKSIEGGNDNSSD